jgi:hypothetical protein
VGSRATVGTLKTGYPHIQALSQNKKQGMHPRVATYIVALDHTSLQRWTPAPPRVPRSRTSPPCRGELRRCHVSLSSGPRFHTEVGSDASTCLMTPVSASPRGEFWCCHISHGPQRAMDYRNKESLSYPMHAARLTYFQGLFLRYRSACKTCRLLQCGSTEQRRPS